MPSPDSKAEGGRPPAADDGALRVDPRPPEPPAEPPSALDLATRFAGGSWAGRAANGAILVAVSLACAFLLTPGLGAPGIPYDEASIGTFSSTVVKAGKDYDIPDTETTERRRQEARDAVLPVYDYDVGVAESAIQRITSAFRLMQETSREVEGKLRPRDGEAKGEEKRRPARRDEPAWQKENEAFLKAYEERREELHRRLEAQLDAETFAGLADARFSDELLREAEKLMLRANGQMVAEYRDQLALSAGRGVVIRRRSGGEVQSEKIHADVSGIRDQNDVRNDPARWAGEPAVSSTPAQHRAVVALVVREVRANLRYSREETEERRLQAVASVKPVVIQLKKGEKIIGDGERIERRHLVVFAAIRAQAGEESGVTTMVGAALYVALILSCVWGFARSSLRRFRPTRKDALVGAALLVAMLALTNVSITVSDALRDRFPRLPAEALYYAIPFSAGAMLLRFVLASEPAVVFTLIFSALAGVLAGNSLAFGVYALLGSLVAAASVARAKDRAALFKAGAVAGLANAAAVICLSLLSGKLGVVDVTLSCVAGFAGGALAAPILVMGITPLVEAFGYTTDIRLLELANLNHPALKELIVQAPGTYHHSIILGSLVEAAAEAIGANPLLARVGAYYHDIGKGKNPLYFGENQKGENRHDKLAPQMSALIIKRHVTEGMEMARQYRLPRQVADIVAQHHGTRHVGFFFHKALKDPAAEAPDDGVYRYPGPKPQSREAALVMIADAVEASARAMQDPTPQKLQALVQKIINAIFADGQLDECELTLRDLNEIARAYYRTLTGVYHERPDYPAQAVQPVRPGLSEVKAGLPGAAPDADDKKPGDPKRLLPGA